MHHCNQAQFLTLDALCNFRTYHSVLITLQATSSVIQLRGIFATMNVIAQAVAPTYDLWTKSVTLYQLHTCHVSVKRNKEIITNLKIKEINLCETRLDSLICSGFRHKPLVHTDLVDIMHM